ncbi:MAG TPA: transcription elongation factor GreB [Gammaproteobacteria bacterium]|nr:transcription elongation factor GreB [Gammaproteobacteria bacterium]HIK68575.1 transcription elongation factor GreB [Pseudomonadales bacterium]
MSNKIYITPNGASGLRSELQYLWKEKRPEVTQKVSAAAALGDRSENADYIYGKKQLREIDSRIRYLEKRLDNLVIVDRIPDNTDRVYFGAWVVLESQSGDSQCLRIVGGDEFDLKKGWISVNSPVAKSLLGKKLGDIVTAEVPAGKVELEILQIRYQETSADA